MRLLATTGKLCSFVLFKITEDKIFLPKFRTSEYAEQLLGHTQLITHELLKESIQSQLKQKVYFELVKCWSNCLNNKAMLKVQVVEFQEKYPWVWTTPCNSSSRLISVLHPLEWSVSTLKQSKQENCMFIHTLKNVIKRKCSCNECEFTFHVKVSGISI